MSKPVLYMDWSIWKTWSSL